MRHAVFFLSVFLLVLGAVCRAADYPTGKLVIADYQGGRATRPLGGTPGIWTYDGNALQSSVPTKRRVSNADLMDANGRNQLAAMAYPAVGMQSQEDEEYVEYQILLAKAARIDGFVVEWHAPGDPAFLNMQKVAERLGFFVGANWCVSQTLKWDVASWETNVLKATATQAQKLQFGYEYARSLKAELYDKPTALKLNGRPLLLLFGGDYFANADLPQLRTEWGGTTLPLIGRYMLGLPDAYAAGVLKQGANLVDGFYPWSGSAVPETSSTDPELAPLMAVPTHDSFHSADNLLAYRERWIGYTKNFADKGLPLRMGCVMPGADNRACGGWGTKIFYIARKDGETHRRQWELYARERENLDLVLVATWNDFTEDTVIEPTLERGQRDVEIAEAGSAAFKGVPSDPSGLSLPKRLFDLRKGYGQLRRLGFAATGPKDRMDAIAEKIASRQYAAAAAGLSDEEARLQLLNSRVTSPPVVTTVLVDPATEKSVAAGGNLWLTLPPSVDVLMSTLRCDTELTWEWLDSETSSYSVLASNGSSTGTVAQIIGTGTGNWISARIRVFDENCPFARDTLDAPGKAILRFSGKVTCRNVVLKTFCKDLPPSISVEPKAGAVVAGRALRLSVEAGGTGGVAYQWRKDGVNLAGKTAENLDIASFSGADVGDYQCVVSSGSASVTSAAAAMTLIVSPEITAQPQSVFVAPGAASVFTVTASGTAPIGYQWQKDGVNLAGGTQQSFTISSASLVDEGSYTVVVSNQAGTVSSSIARLAVVSPITIARQPSSVTIPAGGSLSLSVSATSAAPLSFQWYKNETLLSGGTAATFAVGTALVGDSGTYKVVVSNSGAAVSSANANVLVSDSEMLVLRQPSNVALLRGAAVSVAVQVVPASGGSTSYQLCSVAGGTFTAVPSIQGGVSSPGGVVEIPLGAISGSTGQYCVEFTRVVDGKATVVRSQPFEITLHDFGEVAGTYRALLEDAGGVEPVGDGAFYRGVVTVHVSRLGAVSGQLQYNEPRILPGAGNASRRVYSPVFRSFTSNLVPRSDSPLVLTCAPTLGAVRAAGRQSVNLELDLGKAGAPLAVEVRDAASAMEGSLESRYSVCRASGMTRLCTSLGDGLQAVAGGYLLSANSAQAAADASRNGFVSAHIFPSGRVLWMTRSTGYTGCGSSSLNLTDPGNPVLALYERQSQSSSARFHSTSFLGILNWRKSADGGWIMAAGSVSHPDQIERQGTFLSGAKDISGFKSSGVVRLSTSDGDSCRWNGGAGVSLPAPNPTLKLVVSDPAAESGAHAWKLAVSSSGLVSAEGVAVGGKYPPPLRLRLDKNHGMWIGSYGASKVRRLLSGAFIDSADAPGVSGRGWVESGAFPDITSWRWELAAAR
jgi:hypothetical protein